MGKQWKQERLYFLSSKITSDGDCNHEIKRCLLLGKKSYDTASQQIKKQRHHFANKGLSSQSYDFSSNHVWMWELDYKESWAWKSWCCRTMLLEKTLENPLDSKEIQPVHPKWNQSWIFIETATSASQWEEMTRWKRPGCWERLKAGGEGEDREWDDWMASPTWWTWVWASSGS